MKLVIHGGVVALALALAACSGGGDAGSEGSTPAAAAAPEFPAAQQQFHALNKACHDNYRNGQNEIQKSLAFNECNRQRTEFAARSGISGWTATIRDISTDQGADVVTLDLVAEVDGYAITYSTVGNRLSDVGSNSLITPDNPLFGVLAGMKEGDRVTFDATFLRDPSGKRGIWEASITEQGSMSDPAFNVKFVDIRPFGAPAASNPDAPPAQEAGAREGAGMDSADAAEPSSVDDAYCGNMYRNLTPADMSDDAVARFKTECPAYDLPIQWQDAGLADAGPSEDATMDQLAKPSFDCAKASTRPEQLVCSDSGLARLDANLADTYAAARARVSDKTGLKDAQNAWRRDVRDACGDVDCVRRAYEERIEHLQRL